MANETTIPKLKWSVLSVVIITFFILAGGLFFWFAVRPGKIKSACNTQAIEKARKFYAEENAWDKWEQDNIKQGRYHVSSYETYYSQCLREKGL